MDTQNQIIISVRLDESKTVEQLQQLVTEITATKKAQTELVKVRDADKISTDDYAKAALGLQLQLKGQQTEHKTLTADLTNYRKATTTATDSIDQLKAKSALLTAQYNAMGEAERTTSEAGKVLTAELNATNKALLAGGVAVGDSRRNVGAYGNELKNAGVGAKELTGGLQTVTDTALKPFQATLEKGGGLFGKYKSGADLVKQGLAALKPAGEEGAGGFKAVAAGIALTGLGVFLLLLSTVISYFTQTNEGGKILKQGLAALGAVVTTVANTFTGAGKSLVQAFRDPKQALNDLLDFLKNQVVNRLAAFGVLIDGIRNRDFKKITDSVLQFNLGITNGTDKISDYAKGIGKAASSAADLEAQFQVLKKSRAKLEADEILEKGRVEELIRLSKDRTVSAGDRLNKLREAGKLEEELSAKSLKQTTAELTAIKQRNEAKSLSRTADEIQEERDKQKEYNNTVVERNNTLATIKARQSKFILEGRAELTKDQKERAAVAQQAKEDAIKAQQTEQERLLLTVEKGSAAELVVRQRLLQLAADLEIAGAKKTADEKALIQSKANVEIQKLQDEFREKEKVRALAMYDAELASVNAELTLVQKGSDQETDLRREAIDTQLQKELAALNQRKDNAAQEALLRANAANSLNNLNYSSALAKLDTFLEAQRQALDESYARGQVSEKQYAQAVIISDQLASGTRLSLARNFSQQTAALEKQDAATKIAALKSVTVADQAEHAKRVATAEGLAQSLTALFAETVSTTGATLEDFARKALLLLIDSVTSTIIGAEIKILAEAFASADSIATFGALGGFKGLAIIGALTAATAPLKAILTPKNTKLADGGLADGPSHEQGGIPLLRQGRHTGIEIEGGEAIINKRSTTLFLPYLSLINQAGGGRVLLPASQVLPRLALGGLAVPTLRESPRGSAGQNIDYKQIGNEVAGALRRQPPVNRWVDWKNAEKRNTFTEELSNS